MTLADLQDEPPWIQSLWSWATYDIRNIHLIGENGEWIAVQPPSGKPNL